jgi:ABC-type multidrug transport system fused ATPase/permease subunit
MNSRFLTNAGLSLIGAFTVVASMVWAPATFMWLMLAAGILAIALAAATAIPGRGLTQRTLDGVIGILGAWTIVASLVFSAGAVTWLGFASGVAFVGLAFAGLALHELHTERVVHAFELRTPAEEPTYEPARG